MAAQWPLNGQWCTQRLLLEQVVVHNGVVVDPCGVLYTGTVVYAQGPPEASQDF